MKKEAGKLSKPSVLIRADGTFEHMPPANGAAYELAELQGLVGGYIEVIRTPLGMVMVMDEEGKLKEKAVNVAATEIFRGLGVRDVVVGDVVYCDPAMVR